MLRLQGKEITPDTLDAVAQISKFLALLAKDYNLDREDKLFKDEEWFLSIEGLSLEFKV